jgi:uncharacterized membrane protein HdeD (DUF308 family)
MDEQDIVTTERKRLNRAESGAWGGTVLLGFLWCVVGVLCIGAVGVASVAAVYYVGVLMALAGLMGVIFGFRGGRIGGGAVVLGILSLVVGVLLFIHPEAGLSALTLVLIGYFWIAGFYRVVTSLVDRYENWGWDLAYGLCAIALGFIAVRSWPVSRFFLLGTLVGVDFIIRGAELMALGFTGRRALRVLHSGARP